jgi:hypothetical protein
LSGDRALNHDIAALEKLIAAGGLQAVDSDIA